MRVFAFAARSAAVILGLATYITSAHANTCPHRGILPDGTTGMVQGPCLFPPYNGPGAPGGGVAASQLLSDYDLDVVMIERSPRYPR
jgi:hypothetical protein